MKTKYTRKSMKHEIVTYKYMPYNERLLINKIGRLT